MANTLPDLLAYPSFWATLLPGHQALAQGSAFPPDYCAPTPGLENTEPFQVQSTGVHELRKTPQGVGLNILTLFSFINISFYGPSFNRNLNQQAFPAKKLPNSETKKTLELFNLVYGVLMLSLGHDA